MVLAIARGGLALGMGLGYALAVKNISVVNVEFYTGVNQRLDVPIMLPPTPAAVDLSGLKVLVADDVADTGRTLDCVHAFCEGHVAEVRTVVIYEKPQSVITPDYSWRSTERWIDFPWSVLPPVVKPTRSRTDAGPRGPEAGGAHLRDGALRRPRGDRRRPVR